eukprot:5027114-Heterocapsa_arctica.AAC.1
MGLRGSAGSSGPQPGNGIQDVPGQSGRSLEAHRWHGLGQHRVPVHVQVVHPRPLPQDREAPGRSKGPRGDSRPLLGE